MNNIITKFRIFEQSIIGTGEFATFDNDNGEEFWGNKGAGILPYSKSTNRFLLNLRSDVVNEPNEWGIWGGKIDDDEDIEIASIREFEEESGFNENIKLIPIYIFENPNGNFKYYNFIGLIDNEFTPTLDWESKDFKWATLEELFKQENKHFGLIGLLNDKETKEILKDL